MVESSHQRPADTNITIAPQLALLESSITGLTQTVDSLRDDQAKLSSQAKSLEAIQVAMQDAQATQAIWGERLKGMEVSLQQMSSPETLSIVQSTVQELKVLMESRMKEMDDHFRILLSGLSIQS